jgi:hypothetical protein
VFIAKLTIFNLSGYQIFIAVKLHVDVYLIGTADSVDFLFQKIGDAAVFFEILGQLPGFMNKQVKFIITFTAANI